MGMFDDFNQLNLFKLNAYQELDNRLQEIDKAAAKVVADEISKLRHTKEGEVLESASIIAGLTAINKKIAFEMANLPQLEKYIEDIHEVERQSLFLHGKYNGVSSTPPALSQQLTEMINSMELIVTESYKMAITPALRNVFIRTVAFGLNIEQVTAELEEWVKQSGQIANVAVPSFSRDIGGIARDTVFQVTNTVNSRIREVTGAKYFLYVGGKVQKSRPLCIHLVDGKKIWEFEEMPALIAKYPDGLYNGLNAANFADGRGWRCLHDCVPVVNKDIEI